VAYNDTTAGNSGGAYRTDDVDIEATTDTGGGYDVGYIVAGEWLKYTVNVASNGIYNVSFRVAGTTAGTLHLQNGNGTNLSGAVSVPNTGGFQTWTTVTVSNIALSAGQQTLRVYFDAGGYNMN